MWSAIPGGRDAFAFARAQLLRTDHDDPATNEAATALLRLTVKDPDERRVGRAFSSVAIELALASIPGFYGLGGPAPASPYGVFWPTTVPAELCPQTVRVGDRVTVVDATIADGPPPTIAPLAVDVPPAPSGPTVATALGRVVGARSGDKGGTANLGVFARSAEAYAWLAALPHRRAAAGPHAGRDGGPRGRGATSCPTCGRSTS